MSIPLHLLRFVQPETLVFIFSWPRYIPRFLCLCFEDVIRHQGVFLKISQTHLDKWPQSLATANFECKYSTFSLKWKCSVSRQFSPQARWRPFPHHLLEANLRRLGGVHFIRWKSASSVCLGTTTRPIKIKVIDLLSESETWVKTPSDPQIPKHQTIQMIRVLNQCMNGLKYLSSTSESHWNNKCTHHLNLFVTKLLHPGMISPNSTKSYGTLQLYDPVTCPPSRCWHNAKQVTGQAIALYDGGVGDDVRLNAGLSHIFQQHTGFLHAATFGTGISIVL